jgi:hypothetical protein
VNGRRPDPAAQAALNRAWDLVNALGGAYQPAKGDWRAGYNAAIDDALDALQALGAQRPHNRSKPS